MDNSIVELPDTPWNKLLANRSEGKAIVDDPRESHKTFIKAIHNMEMLGEADALINSVDLSDCPVLIDAGGGSGIYALSLCQKYPGLQSIILDSHATLAVTQDFVSRHKETCLH